MKNDSEQSQPIFLRIFEYLIIYFYYTLVIYFSISNILIYIYKRLNQFFPKVKK